MTDRPSDFPMRYPSPESVSEYHRADSPPVRSPDTDLDDMSPPMEFTRRVRSAAVAAQVRAPSASPAAEVTLPANAAEPEAAAEMSTTSIPEATPMSESDHTEQPPSDTGPFSSDATVVHAAGHAATSELLPQNSGDAHAGASVPDSNIDPMSSSPMPAAANSDASKAASFPAEPDRVAGSSEEPGSVEGNMNLTGQQETANINISPKIKNIVSVEIEANHYPEIVENGQGTRRLELMGVSEQLRDPAERRHLFAEMTPSTFTKLVGYANSITRAEKIEYGYEDGQIFDATPSLEDKGELMDLTAETVKDIANNPEFDDRTALRRIGLTMAGAINYIHPKEDGNGRTGRVIHYVAEFGTERGDEAANEELYAAIGKLPVYDTDSKVAIYDTPPDELGQALYKRACVANPEVAQMSPEQIASAKVVTFLDMMRGATDVPINEDVIRTDTIASKGGQTSTIKAGTMDGVALYEMEYLNLSAVPNRQPSDVPEGAERVKAQKPSPDQVDHNIHIPIDVM